jgi:DNA polymerase-3 subunit epsilon
MGKLVVAVLVACSYLLAVVAAVLWIGASSLEAPEQALLDALIERRLGAVVMVLLFACVFFFLILRAAHGFLVQPVARAAEEALTLIEDPATRLTAQGSSELQALAAAVNRLAEQRQTHDAEIEARVHAANAAADADRNRFAVLMSELAQGVIVCNMDGRVLLYNRRARALFSAASGHGVAALGLGRSIYGLFDRHLIAYALEHIEARGGGHRHFVSVTESGRLLRVLVAPIPEAGGMEAAAAVFSGYMTMIDDMTEAFDSESQRDLLLQELTESSRGPVGSLRAAAETLYDSSRWCVTRPKGSPCAWKPPRAAMPPCSRRAGRWRKCWVPTCLPRRDGASTSVAACQSAWKTSMPRSGSRSTAFRCSRR